MPVRSNDLQKLVHLIETQLSGGADVQQCVELQDHETGELREVDILITISSGDHKLRVGVEVTKTKGGTPWVECMIAKHREGRLTDRLILVSERGFSRGAVKKAEAQNVELIELVSDKAPDWSEIVRRCCSLWFGKVDMTPQSVSLTLRVNPQGMLTEIGPETMIWLAGQSRTTTLLQFVHYVVANAGILKDVYARSDRDKLTAFTASGTVDEEAYVVGGDRVMHLIDGFEIKGNLRFSVSESDVQQTSYRGAAIGHGEFQIDDKKAVVAIVERQGEEAIFRVNFSDKDNDPGTVVDLKP